MADRAMSGTLTGARSPEIELYLSLLPSAHRELLRRCAVPPAFDAADVEALSADMSDEDVSVDSLVCYPFVEEREDRPGSWQLRPSVRAALLESWWKDGPLDAVP